MTVSPVFGPIVTSADVEAATISTLQVWLPSYLAEFERRTGRDPGSIPNIRAWATVNKFRRAPQEQLPAAIVVSPGTIGDPERRGDGAVAAWFRIGIAVVVSTSTRETTNELAKLYAAAVRAIVLQNPALEGDPASPVPFANRVRFVGEMTDDVPVDYLEVGASGQVEFDVLVGAIVNTTAGPLQPTIDAPADWPTVETQNLDIEVEALNG